MLVSLGRFESHAIMCSALSRGDETPAPLVGTSGRIAHFEHSQKGQPVKPSLQQAALTTFRADFSTAINSADGAVSLDASIAALRTRISSQSFTEYLSVYSLSRLRRLDGSLARINAIGLLKCPMDVGAAVSSVLQHLDDLGFTMRQAGGRAERIDARLSCRPHA